MRADMHASESGIGRRFEAYHSNQPIIQCSPLHESADQPDPASHKSRPFFHHRSLSFPHGRPLEVQPPPTLFHSADSFRSFSILVAISPLFTLSLFPAGFFFLPSFRVASFYF